MPCKHPGCLGRHYRRSWPPPTIATESARDSASPALPLFTLGRALLVERFGRLLLALFLPIHALAHESPPRTGLPFANSILAFDRVESAIALSLRGSCRRPFSP